MSVRAGPGRAERLQDPCDRPDLRRHHEQEEARCAAAPTVLHRTVALRRRRELGLTQIELGRFAGCGPDFIYDLEAGKPTIRLDKLVAVLGVLGLELRLADGKRGISVDPSLRGDAAKSGGGGPTVHAGPPRVGSSAP